MEKKPEEDATPRERREKGGNRAAASSRRMRAAAGEEGDAASSSRREQRAVPARDSIEYKMKLAALVMSAVFILVGFIGLAVRGCGGKKVVRIVKKTRAMELIQEARKLKEEGTALYNKGMFDEALEKFYAARRKYEEVIEHTDKEKITPEERAQGLSYEWIEDEYCEIGPLIQAAREMKVRADARREYRKKHR